MKNLEKIFDLKVFKKYWYMYIFFIVVLGFDFFLLDTGVTFLFVEFNLLGSADIALASGVYIPLHVGVYGILLLWFSFICDHILCKVFKKWVSRIDELGLGGVVDE